MQNYFSFLDDLRDSGVNNMFGAGLYLQREFGIGKRESYEILEAWMKSFKQSKEV